MKEEAVLFVAFFVASILIMTIIPTTRAWEYYDTTIDNPKTDNWVEGFGPRADKIQISIYANEEREFDALEAGDIDVTDWPVNYRYQSWTTDPLQQKIAVVDTGSEFGMYILDLRLDNRSTLDDGTANPAYNAKNGNPMANLALRRAIASICDRDYAVNMIISGGHPPALASALYTPLSPAYGVYPWGHPELNPGGVLAQWCYVLPNGTANVAGGNAWLSAAGYTYDPATDARKDSTGFQFTINFAYKSDNVYRRRFATEVIQPLMEAAPPNGLGMKNNLVLIGLNSAGSRQQVMLEKKNHMYIGGWSLATDPYHLYYLFHAANYWHPGAPPNYMYYPGDGDMYVVPSSGWHYTGFPQKYGWASSDLDFSDTIVEPHVWNSGDMVWMNPENYWSWEMMTATTQDRAHYCALKCQEFLAWYVCGVPLWASKSYTAFHRKYSGSEAPYSDHPWEGVVDQNGSGVWSKWSFYNMHTDNAPWGAGQSGGENMIVRWGFRQSPISLNPLYADSSWDWYVLNLCYDRMIGTDPYSLADMQGLADKWEVGTWDTGDLGLGTCTVVTFYMRHDMSWSDGVPITSSDVKFTLGGPLVTGSISNLLDNKGYPPAYWSSQTAHILSIATPDPWTVTCYLDVHNYFDFHSMLGFSIVLPEHIWKPMIESPPSGKVVTDAWDMPNMCSGGWMLDRTWDPTLHGNVIVLSKNMRHYMQDPYSEQADNRPRPIRVWTSQTSNARQVYGNTHYIYPKSGDTTINLAVNVYMHNYYLYETGATKSNVYPMNYLDGLKNVTLMAWTGSGSPGDPANYVSYRVIATNSPFIANRGETEEENYVVTNVTAWWYIVKVDILINSLHYYNGASWVDASGSNPFNGMTYTYREYALVTSRYDIGGANMKPFSAVKYQPISDVKVDVKDLYACGKAYGSVLGYADWNAACDVNNDFKVDVKDYYKIAQQYGWTVTSP